MKTLTLGLAASVLVMLAHPVAAQDSSTRYDQISDAKMDHSTVESSDLTLDPTSENSVVMIAKVNGLVCDFCAQALKKVFKKEDAVEALNVDLNAGEVQITLKSGQSLPDEHIEKLIRNSGYSLVSMHRASDL